MSECIFCKIIDGKIPCYKIYEDNHILAFLDISQTTEGHALVVTKEHFNNFLSVPENLLSEAMTVAQKIARAEVNSLGAKGVNILINTNEAAGQTVMHFHIHVIPRYDDSDKINIEFVSRNIEHLNLPSIVDSIKNEL